MTANRLFRTQVLQARAQRLQGEVSVQLPTGWHWTGALLLTLLVVAISFLATARYARFEIAPGVIEAESGVASILPTRPGVITDIYVRNGATVVAGQPIALLETADHYAPGARLTDSMLRAVGGQAEQVEKQLTALRLEATANAEQVRAELTEISL